MRVDWLLGLAAALLFGGAAAIAPVPAAVTAAGFVLLLWSRVRHSMLLGLSIAFALGGLRARLTLDDFEARRWVVLEELKGPLRCAGRGVITASPTLRGGSPSYVADFEGLDCEGRRLPGPRRVRLYGGPTELGRGDSIEVVAQLAPVQLFRNLDLSDPTPGAARRGAVLSGMALAVSVVERGRGLSRAIDAARGHARRRIDATFSPAAAPMGRALVLGESDLDPEDDEAFRKSGLSHLLAVSGTHLVFAVLGIVRGLSFLLVRFERLSAAGDVGRLSAAFGSVLALVYADFAGGSGSAWRAAWMLSAGLATRAAGRKPVTSRAIAVSLLVGAALDPLAAFDLSFLLSLGATAGLVVFGQPLSRRLAAIEARPLRWVALSIGATLSSMLPCAPLIAMLSPELGLGGVLANVLAAPIGEAVALPLCLLHSLLGAVPALEQGTALVASGALLVVKKLAHTSAAATFLGLAIPPPGPWHIGILTLGGAGAVLSRTRVVRFAWLVALSAGVVGVEFATRCTARGEGNLRIMAVDVGQGDATLIDLPDGRLMLIDGGGIPGGADPGKSVLLPLLRARRRDFIDVAVLSHPHPDHFTGLASVLERVAVGELWDSGQGEREGAGPVYAAMLSALRARAVPIRRPRELCAKPRRFGGASVEVLGPCPDFVPGRDANDNSIVIKITFGARAALLTGDAEHEEEQELAERHGKKLRADFLKVGHHGSRTSSSMKLLFNVRPEFASISCGVRNRFGHPHEEALTRLRAANVRAFRLDRSGSLIFRTDGSNVELSGFSLYAKDASERER